MKHRLGSHISKNANSIPINQNGETAIENGLIEALLSLALVAGATSLGGNLDSLFSSVAGVLGNAPQ